MFTDTIAQLVGTYQTYIAVKRIYVLCYDHIYMHIQLCERTYVTTTIKLLINAPNVYLYKCLKPPATTGGSAFIRPPPRRPEHVCVLETEHLFSLLMLLFVVSFSCLHSLFSVFFSNTNANTTVISIVPPTV